MKRLQIALALGIMIASVPVSGSLAPVCSMTVTAQAAQEQTVVYGEITNIDGENITIETGTINYEALNTQSGGEDQERREEVPEKPEEPEEVPEKPEGETDEEPAEMGQPADVPQKPEDGTDEEPAEMGQPADAPQKQEENMPSLLEKDGGELTVTITEKTSVKSIDQTEGETASADILKIGMIAAFQMNDSLEASAISIMGSASQSRGDAPEKPNGQEPPEGMGQGGPGGDAPEKPDGQEPPEGMGQGGPGGDAPEKPDGQEPPEGMGQGGPGGEGQGGPGGSSGVESYDAVNEYTEDTELESEEIVSEGTDENAVLVSSKEADVTIRSSTVTRTSDDSTGGDSSSFYGVGAALLATDGTLYVSGTDIETDAAGAAGAFAYGDGVVYIADSTINTRQNTSGGIHAAGGGTLYAWDLDVETNGGSAAAIRSDRGGGTMVIDGGTYVSNGLGSPAIYCTADISVKDADLAATGSEAVCIEGLNAIRLYDCSLSGAMTDQDQNDITWNVIVYQSMSGDSVEGNGTFQMTGGTLKAENGGMFYTTNTESTFVLKDVKIEYADDNPFFLQVTGNTNARGWGSTGSNGADCLFTTISQEMEGDIIWDSISTLDFYMLDGSSLTGAVINDETWAGEGGSGYCSMVIDDTSVWTVTGDCTLTSLSNAGRIADEEGNDVTVVGTDGTVYVQGSSEYVITVENYQTQADATGAAAVSVWENYETEKPEQLG